jgi:glycerol-3-phosphate dehydrogenase
MGGLHCPGAGIVSPYEYAIAMMENALANGVTLRTGSRVTAMSAAAGGASVEAGGREYRANFVVNASGTGAEEIAAMAGPPPFAMRPRKGQYIVFRRGSAAGLDTVVFQPPGRLGKGILVTPTTWGNLMAGPDAQEAGDTWNLGTDPESLAEIIRTARRSISDFDLKQAIRVFSGLRPAADRGDFIIEWSDRLPGLLHLAGIESPGLTASPAIALEAVSMLGSAGLKCRVNPSFRAGRRAPVRPGPLGEPAEAARNAQLPEGSHGRIVCRCEQVTEGEIRDALSRGITVKSTDGVKRRTRAGMGACQGAFCGPRVRRLVSEVSGAAEDEVAGPSRDRAKILADLDAMRKLLDERP